MARKMLIEVERYAGGLTQSKDQNKSVLVYRHTIHIAMTRQETKPGKQSVRVASTLVCARSESYACTSVLHGSLMCTVV